MARELPKSSIDEVIRKDTELYCPFCGARGLVWYPDNADYDRQLDNYHCESCNSSVWL